MPTLLEIIDPGYWLKRAAYGRDLSTFDTIKNWPTINPRLREQIYSVLISYSANNGFKTVSHNLLRRLESRRPVSLYELDRLYYILNYAKNTAYNPDNSDGRANAELDSLLGVIAPYRESMRENRIILDSHDKIIEEQDYTKFNTKMLRFSILAAAVSAIAAIISTCLAILTYLKH